MHSSSVGGCALALLVSASLAACGGSTKTVVQRPPPSSTPAQVTQTSTIYRVETTESQTAFLARLNGYCSAGNAAIKTAKAAASPVQALELASRIYHSTVPKMARLRPAAESEEAFARYLRAVKRQSGAVDRALAAEKAGETESVSDLEKQVESYGKERNTAAIDVGADKCGTG